MRTRALARDEKRRRLDNLPANLKMVALAFLSPLTLYRLRRTSKAWRDLGADALDLVPRPVVLGGQRHEVLVTDDDDQRIRDGLSSVIRLSWRKMQWEVLPPMLVARSNPAVATMSDGTIVVVGGDRWHDRMSAEILDPGSNQWRALPPPPLLRPKSTASPLPGRRVLLCGGLRIEHEHSYYGSADAFVLSLDSPGGPAWSRVASMQDCRHAHAALALPSGHVLVAGGMGEYEGGLSTFSSVELFDPGSNEWYPGLQEEYWYAVNVLEHARAHSRTSTGTHAHARAHKHRADLRTARCYFSLALASTSTAVPSGVQPFVVMAIGIYICARTRMHARARTHTAYYNCVRAARTRARADSAPVRSWTHMHVHTRTSTHTRTRTQVEDK